ncbi:hypothetical protein GCM10027294_49240 [Marinactinospora endophytica]
MPRLRAYPPTTGGGHFRESTEPTGRIPSPDKAHELTVERFRNDIEAADRAEGGIPGTVGDRRPAMAHAQADGSPIEASADRGPGNTPSDPSPSNGTSSNGAGGGQGRKAKNPLLETGEREEEINRAPGQEPFSRGGRQRAHSVASGRYSESTKDGMAHGPPYRTTGKR